MKCYLKESKLIENKHNRVQQRIKKKKQIEMNKLKKKWRDFFPRPPSSLFYCTEWEGGALQTQKQFWKENNCFHMKTYNFFWSTNVWIFQNQEHIMLNPREWR